ncbi:MAG: hypothetical protein ACE5I7_10090 [Candidatus Binatia bacterium]
MEAWLTHIAPIAAVGLLFVVVPVVAHAYTRFRGTKVVTCPESQAPAEIELDAARAATTAALGHSELRVAHCNRWPEHEQCGQECLNELD